MRVDEEIILITSHFSLTSIMVIKCTYSPGNYIYVYIKIYKYYLDEKNRGNLQYFIYGSCVFFYQ